VTGRGLSTYHLNVVNEVGNFTDFIVTTYISFVTIIGESMTVTVRNRLKKERERERERSTNIY
jgi:hypothetical protein